jgi:hypothetical protein
MCHRSCIGTIVDPSERVAICTRVVERQLRPCRLCYRTNTAESAIESTLGKFRPSIDRPRGERLGNAEEKDDDDGLAAGADGDGLPFFGRTLDVFGSVLFSRASSPVVVAFTMAERNVHVVGRAGRELLQCGPEFNSCNSCNSNSCRVEGMPLQRNYDSAWSVHV